MLGLIKGKRVETALNTLAFTNKGIAPAVLKVLRSAVENASYLSAEKGLDVDLDNLYVKNAIANEGPRMKRIRPAPMGRAYRYQRRMAHIEIELAEKGQPRCRWRGRGCGETAPAKPAVRKPAVKKAAAKKTAAKKKAPQRRLRQGEGQEVMRWLRRSAAERGVGCGTTIDSDPQGSNSAAAPGKARKALPE